MFPTKWKLPRRPREGKVSSAWDSWIWFGSRWEKCGDLERCLGSESSHQEDYHDEGRVAWLHGQAHENDGYRAEKGEGNANSFWQVPLDQWGYFQGELPRKTLVFPQGGFWFIGPKKVTEGSLAVISQWSNISFVWNFKTAQQKLFRGLGISAVINFAFSYC